MAKRTNDVAGSEYIHTNRERPSDPKTLFVRLGLLQPSGGKTRYGARTSVAVSGKVDLARYSLIIPAFTLRHDIPSGEDKQRAISWLWNVYEHQRYFGILDLDMDLEAVVKLQALLFQNAPTERYKDKTEAKKAFARRLVDGSTFGRLLTLCPPFAQLYRSVKALVAALEVDFVAYFSGGGGFRILFFSPYAWRRVAWGQSYAAQFHGQELRKLLRLVAPSLAEELLSRILASTDKNIYDCDKGTKPDLLAHFETRVFPRQLDESFENSHPSLDAADEPLSKAIRDFWQRIFLSVPMDSPRIVAAISKPAVVRYPHALYQFAKSPKPTATHLVLQGELTSYRRVDDPERLYRLMLEQRRRGIPLNVHEIRTSITRHALDYDGGPSLLEPLRRSDGDVETPLHALQEISQSKVLTNGAAFPGLLLSCPPRPGTLGTRAHLVWPDWHVRLVDEEAIVLTIRLSLRLRWPQYDWSKIIESPPKLRALFSDTVDKQTGLMANRAIRMETAFNAQGVAIEVSTVWPDRSDIGLLRLCSLRHGAEVGLAAILPSVTRFSRSEGSATASANLDSLPTSQRAAILLTLRSAMEEVRIKHSKPLARLYPDSAIRVYSSRNYRMVTLGIMNHRQCARATSHEHNNVMLVLHMDHNEWELRCFKSGCPQRDKADNAWGRGVIDTASLRTAWPLIHPAIPRPDSESKATLLPSCTKSANAVPHQDQAVLHTQLALNSEAPSSEMKTNMPSSFIKALDTAFHQQEAAISSEASFAESTGVHGSLDLPCCSAALDTVLKKQEAAISLEAVFSASEDNQSSNIHVSNQTLVNHDSSSAIGYPSEVEGIDKLNLSEAAEEQEKKTTATTPADQQLDSNLRILEAAIEEERHDLEAGVDPNLNTRREEEESSHHGMESVGSSAYEEEEADLGRWDAPSEVYPLGATLNASIRESSRDLSVPTVENEADGHQAGDEADSHNATQERDGPDGHNANQDGHSAIKRTDRAYSLVATHDGNVSNETLSVFIPEENISHVAGNDGGSIYYPLHAKKKWQHHLTHAERRRTAGSVKFTELIDNSQVEDTNVDPFVRITKLAAELLDLTEDESPLRLIAKQITEEVIRARTGHQFMPDASAGGNGKRKAREKRKRHFSKDDEQSGPPQKLAKNDNATFEVMNAAVQPQSYKRKRDASEDEESSTRPRKIANVEDSEPKLYSAEAEQGLRERVRILTSPPLKLQQKQVANEAGLDPPTLSKWLKNGTKKKPERNKRCLKMERWLNLHAAGNF